VDAGLNEQLCVQGGDYVPHNMLVPIRAESSFTSGVVTAEGRREEEGRRRREVKGGEKEKEGGRYF
jgi:hypothetical protein